MALSDQQENKMKYTYSAVSLEHKYIFIVLECHKHKKHEKIHGVYTSREIAENKAAKIAKKNPDHGYLAILKKPIEGPTQRPLFMY